MIDKIIYILYGVLLGFIGGVGVGFYIRGSASKKLQIESMKKEHQPWENLGLELMDELRKGEK